PLLDHGAGRGIVVIGNGEVLPAGDLQRPEADLERKVAKLLAALDANGGLWIAWPKKASKVPTDITENTVREVFLPLGLVDNKVCAIDDTWSGLRLVVRLENRPKKKR
ncbi:MAG: hypothetical protein ACXVAN_08635, partial [Polyangia bacterium]